MYDVDICIHMGDHTRVNLRVEQETKEKWDEFVEKSDHYTTLSGMIRAVVSAEVESGHDNASESEGRERQYDDRFESIESRLDELMDEVKSADADDYAVPVDDSTPESPPSEPRPYPTDDVFEALPDGQGPSHGETASQIAERLEYAPSTVTGTAELLRSKSGRVQSERIGEETIYWKEV